MPIDDVSLAAAVASSGGDPSPLGAVAAVNASPGQRASGDVYAESAMAVGYHVPLVLWPHARHWLAPVPPYLSSSLCDSGSRVHMALAGSTVADGIAHADRRSSSGVAFALAAGLGCAAGLLFAYAVHRRCCRHRGGRDDDDERVAARLGLIGDDLRQLRGALDSAKAREGATAMSPPDEGESACDGTKVSFDLPHTLCTADNMAPGGGGMRKSMSHASTASSGEFVDASEQLDVPNGEAPPPHAAEVSGTGAVADDNSVKDMAELDALVDEGSVESRREAYSRLRRRVDEHSQRGSMETADDVKRSANYLWRLARAGYLCSQTYVGVDEQKRKQLCFEAKDYAQAAVKLAPDSFEVHKWYAVVLGAVTDYLPTKDKIKAGHEFKEHIDRAIELRPTDGVVHHLKGRWCHSVASLSWWERKAAAALYAAPPTSSLDEALHAFLKAEEASPGWLENLLWIGKCHVDKQDAAGAGPYLKRIVETKPANPDDELAHKEAVAMYATMK